MSEKTPVPNTNEQIPVEKHPWPPFIPKGAQILVLGTFPPGRKRWSMEFYYPNKTNDFWYVMGVVFFGDKYALCDNNHNFSLQKIQDFLTERHIAISDVARRVKRLKGNASDKYLEIVEALPLSELLSQMPACHTIVTTGQKAAEVIAQITGTQIPQLGKMIVAENGLEIWRMPSTSRAYPLPLLEKARYYDNMLRHTGIL